MKNRDILLVIAVICLAVAASLWLQHPEDDPYKVWRDYLGDGDFEVTFSKVEHKADIPESILENIEQLSREGHLVRGYWLFNPNFFEVDHFYIMICGGDDYPDGYDVTITEAEYEYSNPNIKNPLSDLTFRNLHCDLKVSESGKGSVGYNTDFARPLLVFMINEREADDLGLRISAVDYKPLNRQNNFPIQ